MEKPSLHRAQFTETMCVATNRKINTLEAGGNNRHEMGVRLLKKAFCLYTLHDSKRTPHPATPSPRTPLRTHPSFVSRFVPHRTHAPIPAPARGLVTQTSQPPSTFIGAASFKIKVRIFCSRSRSRSLARRHLRSPTHRARPRPCPCSGHCRSYGGCRASRPPHRPHSRPSRDGGRCGAAAPPPEEVADERPRELETEVTEYEEEEDENVLSVASCHLVHFLVHVHRRCRHVGQLLCHLCKLFQLRFVHGGDRRELNGRTEGGRDGGKVTGRERAREGMAWHLC